MKGALQSERKKAEPRDRGARHYDFLLALISAIALAISLGQYNRDEQGPTAQYASSASFYANPRLTGQNGSANRSRSRADFVVQDKVDINLDDEKKLQKLPGVGPVLAKRIVDYRINQGAFTGPADLMQVRGIGPKKYSAIAPLIVAGRPDNGG
jgi:competence protein ComEA